jgi:hypothetical protein
LLLDARYFEKQGPPDVTLFRTLCSRNKKSSASRQKISSQQPEVIKIFLLQSTWLLLAVAAQALASIHAKNHSHTVHFSDQHYKGHIYMHASSHRARCANEQPMHRNIMVMKNKRKKTGVRTA